MLDVIRVSGSLQASQIVRYVKVGIYTVYAQNQEMMREIIRQKGRFGLCGISFQK